jgi:hypothetical protein
MGFVIHLFSKPRRENRKIETRKGYMKERIYEIKIYYKDTILFACPINSIF